MSYLRRAAVFGGVYNNYLSLDAVLADARKRGATEFYCLGDVGGFGPHPDRSFPSLRSGEVLTIQGNYDHSIGHSLEDCACGYTDPRDNAFAQVSYDYTLANTNADNRAWLRSLPEWHRASWGGKRVLMAHGSPRRVNEFLWESTSPDSFLEHVLEGHKADVLFVTHTGIHWQRELSDGKTVINVGAIGRPANDGDPRVWYSLVTIDDARGSLTNELIPVAYDHQRLADEMRTEGLPEEFAQTILTGWWTTCLEVLPAKERARSQF
ncbi:MAG: putative phosphodiesterase [Bradymonadia bacterium]|jgi:predicted phosphodiesterase